MSLTTNYVTESKRALTISLKFSDYILGRTYTRPSMEMRLMVQEMLQCLDNMGQFQKQITPDTWQIDHTFALHNGCYTLFIDCNSLVCWSTHLFLKRCCWDELGLSMLQLHSSHPVLGATLAASSLLACLIWSAPSCFLDVLPSSERRDRR